MFIVLAMVIVAFMNHEMNGKLSCYETYNRNEILKQAAMQCEACDKWIQKALAQYEEMKKQGDDVIDQYGFDFYGDNKDDYDLITDPKLIQFFEQSAREIGLDRAPRVYVEKVDSKKLTKDSDAARASVNTVFLSRDTFNALQDLEKSGSCGWAYQILLHEMGHIKHSHTVRYLGLLFCRVREDRLLLDELYKLDCSLKQYQDKIVDYDTAVELHGKLDAFRENALKSPLIKISEKQQIIEDLILKYRLNIDFVARSGGSLSLKDISSVKYDIISVVDKAKNDWKLAINFHMENQADFEAYTHLKCYKCAESMMKQLKRLSEKNIAIRYMKGYWPISFAKKVAVELKQKGLLCQYHQNQESC